MDAEIASDRITVVITDDHAVVREGLRLIIDGQDRMSVLGEAKDLEGARESLREHTPDVLVLDVNLEGESGLDAIPELRREWPDTAIVVLTMQDEPSYARQALEGGASGYVIKEAAGEELVRAIRAAAEGKTYLHPEVGARLLQARLHGDSDALSERELQILRLIALGHTNAEIAGELFLSVRTIESHRARIHEKLGVTGRAELTRYAREKGLIER
jgi:two-component system, NarL family, response regulator NreC